MSTANTLQNAFAGLVAVFPTALASVVVDGATITGLRDGVERGGGLSLTGTDARSSGTVRVRSDLIRAMKIGEQITVDGNDVFVTADNTDAAGIIRHISYQNSRPNGIDLGPL